jgi:TonB family protein
LWLPAGLLILAIGGPLPTLQAQQPSVVEQNRLVPPKDALHGADWLKAQGVQQGLDKLDLGADSKGNPIKFEISKDGEGVQIRLTGSGLDNFLAGGKTGGGIMGKFKKKKDDAAGTSGLTVTDLFGARFAAYDPENKASMEEKSVGHGLGGIAKMNGLMGGGRDHYLKGTNLYPSDLRTIEQNAPVIKLLAEDKSDEASKRYASIHGTAADADLGTSDPAKIALIQKVNATMDNLTAQEQAGAKTLHFKAESGSIVAHLDDPQTANMDKVLQSMGPDKLFRTGQVTYTKDVNGKGVVAISSSISSQEIDQASGPLKIAIDTGDAKKVEAYQKYKGLNDLNLPKQSSNVATPVFDQRPVVPPPGNAPLTAVSSTPVGSTAVEPAAVRVSAAEAEKLLISRPQATYTMLAKQSRVQGTVKLEFTVTADGAVKDVKVLSGHPLLNGDAVNSVMQSKYRPYMVNGQPTAMRTTTEIVFRLSQ